MLMKRTGKVLFYFFLFTTFVWMTVYGIRHEGELLQMLGVQSVQAKGIGGELNFPILEQTYDIVKSNYVDSLDSEESETKLQYGAIRGMLNSIGDPYTRFMDPTAYKNMMIETKGEFGGIGITIEINRANNQLTVNSIIDDTPAQRVGLKAGDIIMKIDGTTTEYMALDDAVARIRGPKGKKVTLRIWRLGFDDDGKDFDIIRDVIVLKPINKTKMLENKIGYTKLESFSENSANDLEKSIKDLKKQGMKALIFDLRNNPGGLLPAAIDVSRLFVNEGPIVHRQNRSGKLVTYYANGTKIVDVPVVVLVNKYSASASEIVSGALQDNEAATIMGETTFGKGLVQSIFRLDDSSAILVTTDKYLTAKKRDINKHGIEPDIVVKAENVDTQSGKKNTDADSSDYDRSKGPKVGKFPLDEIKGHNGIIFNGTPVKGIFYKEVDKKHYLAVDDVAKLFGAKMKLDEKNKILDIDDTDKDTKDDSNDIQMKRAIEFLKDKIKEGK